MASRRTVELLPEIFRTDTNKKFLGATLDQLTQEPRINRTKGYVGRRIGPGVNPQDYYVREPNATRANYQLEPGVVFLKKDTDQAQDAMTYPGMIDALDVLGANTQRQDRLWESEYYTWDSFCDLDKLTNYSQYYWLPNGPESVDVGEAAIPLTDQFEVTRTNIAYNFSGLAGNNPRITLVRGGNYEFAVNQPGHEFWIQAAPGVNGRLPATPNISSRDVLGVENNGTESGTVIFNVPERTAQDFYYNLVDLGAVDLICDFLFDEINNRYVDQFLADHPDGIDGITNLDQRTLIFTSRVTDVEQGGWEITTPFDPLPRNNSQNGLSGSFDSLPYSETTPLLSQSQRYSIWRVNYVDDGTGRAIMQLSIAQTVPVLNRLRARFGTVYSSTNWYRNTSGFFERIPLLTAVQDTLWYQDSTNPEIFGEIRLVDPTGPQLIDIEEIIGAKNYTSPNGVVFTNGLKVTFRGLTHPERFQNLTCYVEGVGTGPGIGERIGFVDGEAYYGEWHLYQGEKITGPAGSPYFHQYIYDTVEQSLANRGAGAPADAPLPPQGWAGAANGNGIRLVPATDLVTPETYTGGVLTPYDSNLYDSTPYDETIDAPLTKDYITINRSSTDRNAWSRSNRWFHVDVIRYSAERNNFTPVIDNSQRGKRPIIEFRADLRLFNFGTQGIDPVNVIDFSATDAFSDINGTTGYGVDGYEFLEGTRVIFAADLDRNVRNRVYEVTFIDPDGETATAPIINLVPVDQGQAEIGHTVVVTNGLTQQGRSFWFNGTDWQLAQQKTGVNQAPLFDVFDAQGHSFGDQTFYPSTSFAGSRLFGYALRGTAATDIELGFALKYLNINNVGDIVFTNYLYTDTFLYVQDRVGQELAVSSGFVRQYFDRVDFSPLIGWLPAITQNRSRQIFRFTNNPGLLILDVPVLENFVLPPVQIFIDGVFVEPDRYEISIENSNTFITLLFAPPADAVIEAKVLSDVTSRVGYYDIPVNLENNPLNENSSEFTLGTIRTHFETIGQNLQNISGPIVGANNTRDLGNISRYGQNIIQNSSPLVLAGVFLRDPLYDIAQSLQFNSREYEKYKARLIDVASRGNFINLTPSQILDASMQDLSLSSSDQGPFYWSDMIPAGETYTETNVTYSVTSTPTFDLNRVYDFSSANFQSVLIYVNGSILTRGIDYVVSPDAPVLTVTRTLQVGDRISIREYATTFGSFVPNTPTKLGLYPAYRPEIFLDTSYQTPRLVIRGHDGSITMAYGDDRDQVLLEFETRVFNNLKTAGSTPIVADDVIPGQWRSTDYSLSEINSILGVDFLSWIGWNKIDYVSQTYTADNAFSFNYSQSSNKLNNQPLLGAWRGIYQYFYDTVAPNTRPWEMLGFSQEPTWWQDFYGPAPYTSGNLVLWEDLSQGLVRDPAGEYVIEKYRRPDLLSVIPAGEEGQLLPPSLSVMGNTDATSYRRSWTFGDGGPAEYSWRASSSWPFAVMRLLLLTKPAQFTSLFADRDRYRFDTAVEQYLWNGRYRLDAKNLAPLYGDDVSRASYINWVIDYNRQLGMNSTVALETRLNNLDVRLCWRLAAFTDKRFLKIFTERSTPTSLNASLLLPDESYSVLLYENPAFASFQYSSVIVQRTELGWAVLGYSATQPYFNILVSQPFGVPAVISAGGTSVNVSTQHSNTVVQVPYGYVFKNRAAVCDFLVSYGVLLERQGMKFEGRENGYIMNWQQMAQEFLYWSNQGWNVGSMINLNPAATAISITRPGAVTQSLLPVRSDNIVLNQNRQAISPQNLFINRLDNTIGLSVAPASNETINYFSLRFTAYEHMVILDNRSIFSDLIYDPKTGARQSRVLVSGALSADWNGTVNAPGFILNQGNIQDWQPNQTYTKGEIVRFKDELWTASEIIQPSTEFNYVSWLRSDYDEVQQGLLTNAATASDQLANAYSIYNANLENEIDLFSYGLIGFRPRQYMADLDLDDVSQVNLYQQFLGTKGTRGALEIFSLADLGKETAEYNIYEYWSILRGYYGANANRSYIEIQLDPSVLTSDPCTIQVIQPGDTRQADQSVLIQDLWKTSYPITNTNILPTVPAEITDRALPSAGYVNFDDVDITVFSLQDLASQDIDNIGIGSVIWVAAQNSYEWNVYRAEQVPGAVVSVSDNLNGRSVVTFSRAHGLSINDPVIIRFFEADIDGAYTVLSVPTIFSIIIDYAFEGLQTTATGTGLAMKLQTSRVAQASDTVDLPYSRGLKSGNLVWVDRSPQGTWSVLEKTQPFTEQPQLVPDTVINGIDYGASLAQGFFNLSALVGAPNYNPSSLAVAPGAVYAFARNFDDEYGFNSVLSLNTPALAGYGNDIDVGDQEWAVVGAKNSNNQQGYAVVIYRAQESDIFEQRQLLNAGDLEFGATEFGYSVTISQDERWIGISAPGDESSQIGGAFYVFGRQDVQAQSVSYVTDGVTEVFNYSDHIIITDFAAPAWQVVVILDNEVLTPNVDYGIDANDIVFTEPPIADLPLLILRRNAVQLDQQLYRAVAPSSSTGSGVGATFNVNRVRGEYQVTVANAGLDYTPGDVLTISASSIGGGTSPTNDLVLTVTAEINGGVSEFTQSGSGVNNTASFDLALYFAQVTSIWDFTVTVNGVVYRPDQDYEYEESSGFLILENNPPQGAIINVQALSQFEFVDKITVPGLGAGTRFGTSVTTTSDGSVWIAGAPAADNQTGRSYVFNRSSERFQVTTAGAQTFTTEQTLISPTMVKINGEFVNDSYITFGGEYTVTSSNTVAVSRNLQVGDTVEIYTNHFNQIQMITSQQPQQLARFGTVVDQCINDCSLYVSAPRDSHLAPRAGAVELWQNQARLYGTITSLIANPVITPGDTIAINGYLVSATGTTIQDLVEDINDAGVPNASATLTPDLEFTGDALTTVFDVGTIYSSTEFSGTPTTLVLVDDVAQTAGVNYTYNNANQTITFVIAPGRGSVITVVSGRMVIHARNVEVAQPLNKLSVLPGTGSLWNDLGFDLYVGQQIITAPVTQDFAEFGSALFISDDTVTLTVGAPGASIIRETTFDNNTTVFDATSTLFQDAVAQSGALYTYDFLPAYQASATNPGQFVFGQQIVPDDIQPLSRFGSSVDLTTGTLLIGAPGTATTAGDVFQFVNANNTPSWRTLRAQSPAVDVNLLNTNYIFDLLTGTAANYLDFFDPLQGRLLGAVAQNIDYIGAVDPASYNVGPINNRGSRWGEMFQGRVWWDTTLVRFVDPNQGDIDYASKRWGQIFPGSQVQIYQWTASPLPPSLYTGPGTPRSTNSYVLSATVNDQGIISDLYYFWVTGLDSVETGRNKTLSINTITRYIQDPRASGIAYLAPLNPSTVALYNCEDIIAQGDRILHVEFDRIANDAAVHVEYQLIAQDRADAFLDAQLYRKLLDSFCGTDSSGAAVPDPNLAISEQYGVSVRPRQSMFVNRFTALENYLTAVNAVLAQFPISETRSFRLLNSFDPEPSAASQEWNQRVADDQELSFQDLNDVPLGYRYLVASDAANQGLWAIYQVIAGDLPGSRALRLVRIQDYDTRMYWNYRDWYQVGYDPLTRVLTEVLTYSALSTLDVPVGSSVKVTANAQGRWEIYLLTDTGWTRVALQNGTIEFDARLWNYQLGRFGFDLEVFDGQYFDQDPTIETRKILESINQELLVGDLLIERNRALILMFNYILSEQINPDWLTKTSLIDVDHIIRDLQPFQIYRQDNQDFVLDYINEVKPYHTQIREFGLIYRGQDTYLGNVTDFDLPARWDPEQNLFISPVLDNTGTMSTTSSTPSSSPIWQEFPWNQWFQNYLLSVITVDVVEGGENYTVAPQVVVTGEATRQAVMIARINSAGQVIAVDVIDPGAGYLTTAIVTLEGGNGTGARAAARMGNQQVRSISTTIKYDRYQYSSSILDWQANQVYATGDRVRYADRVWEATTAGSATVFDPDDWVTVPAGDLAAADRTMGYYTPTASQPGRELAQLISGIDYPGVQVAAPGFDQNTGFDIGNYDITPFDNISFGPEGLPTYDPQILDAIYQSEFTDPYLGVLPAPAYAGDPPDTGPNPIVISGGAFVDTYSSHAPPELIPGAMFDTLDLKVFSTPGSDWSGQGHGFPVAVQRSEFDSATPILNFQDALSRYTSITVFNMTTGLMLYPETQYTVSWPAQSITVTDGATNGDTLQVLLASLGGGNQVFTRSYLGTDITDNMLIPISTALIDELVIFTNGEQTTEFTYEAAGSSQTLISFTRAFDSQDWVVITAYGGSDAQALGSWSMPVTQYTVTDGSLSYDLDNSFSGTNIADVIVTVNGERARPYNSESFVSDGSTTTYDVPVTSDLLAELIADNDVSVFVGNLALTPGVDFVVDPWDGSTNTRSVTLTSAPLIGSRIVITVRTLAQYRIVGNVIQLLPSAGLDPAAGSTLSVTTFNDTAGQNLLTRVFVGPDTVDGVNMFAVGETVIDTDRVLVSLDGRFLALDIDYDIMDGVVRIPGPAIASDSVVVISCFAQRTVPEAMAFRIFQDMRGAQRLYRISAANSTILTQDLTATSDTIYVKDADVLFDPNLEQGEFGVITINGERITYRTRNTVANTLSGLRRGTVGTGAASHVAGSDVFDMGAGQLLPAQYQRSVIAANFLGTGTQTDFITDITLETLDSTELVEAVQVFVGGILQTSGYSISATGPIRVEFDQAPSNGYQVSVQIQQARVLYAQGFNTASNGVPLQETQTPAADFIRGY